MAVLAAGTFRVPLTVLAPAVIVAADPEVVRAPLDGIVSHMFVRPNVTVEPGQVLFELDSTSLDSRLEIARKALSRVRTEYEQAGQRGLFDPEAKARLVPLAGQMEERSAEVSYLQELRDRIRVTARREGVAVVDDPGEWIGRPVKIGERVMAIAGERDTEIEAWLAVGDVVELESGTPVTLFLNADPFHPVAGTVDYMAYRAQSRPDGSLAYRVRARIEEERERPRLGLKGTLRIESGRAVAAYWLLRRPLSELRQLLGL